MNRITWLCLLGTCTLLIGLPGEGKRSQCHAQGLIRDYVIDAPVHYDPCDPFDRGRVFRVHTGHGGMFHNCDQEECKRFSPFICWKQEFCSGFSLWDEWRNQFDEWKWRYQVGRCCPEPFPGCCCEPPVCGACNTNAGSVNIDYSRFRGASPSFPSSPANGDGSGIPADSPSMSTPRPGETPTDSANRSSIENSKSRPILLDPLSNMRSYRSDSPTKRRRFSLFRNNRRQINPEQMADRSFNPVRQDKTPQRNVAEAAPRSAEGRFLVDSADMQTDLHADMQAELQAEIRRIHRKYQTVNHESKLDSRARQASKRQQANTKSSLPADKETSDRKVVRVGDITFRDSVEVQDATAKPKNRWLRPLRSDRSIRR